MRSVIGSERIGLEILAFQFRQPMFDQAENGGKIQAFVPRGIFRNVRARELEQSGARAKAVFLEVHEGAGELDQAFVEMIVLLAALWKPEFLEHVVGFVKELLIEALEIAEVMRVEMSPVQRLDHLRDARAFLAHAAV